MNSGRKGKVGEREFAALLRENGFHARRGQQFSGSPDSPDVVCDALAWLHIEVKRVQSLNLTDACVQAERDQTRSGLNAADAAKLKKLAWIVAHRRNHAPWLITMRAETFFALLRGELPPVANESRHLTPTLSHKKCAQPYNPHPVSDHPLPLPLARDMIEAERGTELSDAVERVPTDENFGKAAGVSPDVAREARALPGEPEQTEQERKAS